MYGSERSQVPQLNTKKWNKQCLSHSSNLTKFNLFSQISIKNMQGNRGPNMIVKCLQVIWNTKFEATLIYRCLFILWWMKCIVLTIKKKVKIICLVHFFFDRTVYTGPTLLMNNDKMVTILTTKNRVKTKKNSDQMWLTIILLDLCKKAKKRKFWMIFWLKLSKIVNNLAIVSAKHDFTWSSFTDLICNVSFFLLDSWVYFRKFYSSPIVSSTFESLMNKYLGHFKWTFFSLSLFLDLSYYFYKSYFNFIF